jgi:hypothetical protein
MRHDAHAFPAPPPAAPLAAPSEASVNSKYACASMTTFID